MITIIDHLIYTCKFDAVNSVLPDPLGRTALRDRDRRIQDFHQDQHLPRACTPRIQLRAQYPKCRIGRIADCARRITGIRYPNETWWPFHSVIENLDRKSTR